jgi:hypothetical protein
MSARNRVNQQRFWDQWLQSGAVGGIVIYGMSTDGPTPPPCNRKILKKGRGVCVLDGSSNAIETWVRAVAMKADAQVDWHYSGGRANVLHLGDDESRQRVLNVIEELKDELNGCILSVGGPALYRAGDEVPAGTVAVDPDLGPIVANM